jgi:heme-binding protein/cytochrome P460
MKKKLLITGGILLVCFAGIQLIRPELANPPVTGDLEAPKAVKDILKRACYDCHSNETNLRWYDKVVPIYWKVAEHVRDGRKVLNFSDWQHLAPGDQKGKLWEAVNQIQAGAMPLSNYTKAHPSANVAAGDLDILKSYLMGMIASGLADSTKIHGVDEQFKHWRTGQFTSNILPVAVNGISYIPDYKNWQPVSTSDRFDNGTMRVIFGNDIAIKAIQENHINPWPDGTIFAKVAWDKLEDNDGNVHTGEFKQVEYMIKDAQKYASAKGWGWARFKTPAMVPYGKNIAFATECVNCHRPYNEDDFVFTFPISFEGADDHAELINAKASLPSSFNFGRMGLKVMTSMINKKMATMSTLYANDEALHAVMTGAKETPAGAVLALVTWKQQEDKHWFGANIPGDLQSVELVKANRSDAHTASLIYQRYDGKDLILNPDTLQNQVRINYMLSQRPSVMP